MKFTQNVIVTLIAITAGNRAAAAASPIEDHEVMQLHARIADAPIHHVGGPSMDFVGNVNQYRDRDDVKSNSNNNDEEQQHSRKLKSPTSKAQVSKTSKGGATASQCYEDCDPSTVNLADFPQWQEEEGYWIGEYSFYGADALPFTSATWNYRYDQYRGFITGNVKGNAYRQRNVFLYPPQNADVCASNDSVVGTGTCGTNGNTKIFAADQSATTCNTNPARGGEIEGPFAGIFDTKTELIGADNALLYQVFLQGSLFQSQLTTLSETPAGEIRRTRSAQSFFQGMPNSLSFYRERKVDKATFYAELAQTITDYNIQASDTCTWQDGAGGVVDTGLDAGINGCTA
eukprot:CAMPEP_0119573062 /NCGR_PEP_ID=MMETSP1352-20130426/44935_1 /TAXON_ID=265584 /ORGANISM="Stauroneis constricta, Strain CCMP1120" /LENGTH=344 /DNA_ID=CAMNT_0007622749 /DNA_START=651 /DNA_END=1682 /DNA_ORIENTATION=-